MDGPYVKEYNFPLDGDYYREMLSGEGYLALPSSKMKITLCHIVP